MTATKITREELYQLVWKTPMSRLASEFGVSDVALAKTCDRLSVPRPGRGYWAQVAAGLKVKRPPLGKAATGAKEWAIVERTEARVPHAPRPKPPEVPLPRDLRDASESVRRLGTALGATAKDQYGRLVINGDRDPVLAVTVATHRRALLLLSGFAAAAHARGSRADVRQ